MKDKLKEQRQRQAEAVDRGWPFNDPRYECSVITKTREKVMPDGKVVTRTSTKNTLVMNEIPDYALRAMTTTKGVSFGASKPDVYVPTKSPMTALRANGKRKWFRPISIRRFTKLAVKLIKENRGNLVEAGIMNPVSKKVLKGFTKMQIIFPPSKQMIKVD